MRYTNPCLRYFTTDAFTDVLVNRSDHTLITDDIYIKAVRD